MTDVMREMIEQLMGASRAEEEGKKLPPFDHHSVCRAYLLECCPREILADTRLEGYIACRRMHEPAHKADYRRAQEKKDHFYDIEAFDAIDDCVRVVDTEVEKIKDKIKKDTEQQSDSQEFIKSQKIFELNEKIGVALVQVETLGSEGKITESMEMSKTVEELKRKKRELEAEMRSIAPVQQRLRFKVCDACGAQLNILDHESRLADHFGGKMHLGMVEIREKFDQMREKIDERRAEKRRAEDKERQERREHRHDDDEEDRYRDRDRKRERERSRSRSRSRKKHKRRSRSPSSRKSGSKRDRRDSSRERRRERH